MWISAVGDWIDVGAAGQEYGVELLVDTAQSRFVDQRDHPGNGACRSQREDVALTHDPRRRYLAGDAAEALEGLGWDADDWPAGTH